MSSDRGMNSLFDRLDEHLEKCEEDMSKKDYNLASHHAKEAMKSFASPLNRKMPRLPPTNRKEAQNRLEEKIEKEHILNEAEERLRQTKNELKNESTRRTRIERKREVDKLESVVESLRELFVCLNRLYLLSF